MRFKDSEQQKIPNATFFFFLYNFYVNQCEVPHLPYSIFTRLILESPELEASCDHSCLDLNQMLSLHLH